MNGYNAGHTGRENLTKNPSPRIDPGERPADLGWNGKRGTTSRKKNEANPQSLGQENPLFFIGRHTTAAGREARMTEVGPQRAEAGSTTDPIAPTEPAVGMRAGR